MQRKLPFVLVALLCPTPVFAQGVDKKELGTKIPYLRTSSHTFSAGVLTAAPTERLAAPSPNPKKLADTSQVAYTLWRTDQAAASSGAHSAPHTLMFSRTIDGGKTWTSKAIYTSAGLTTGNGYTTTYSVIDFHIGAEGNTVFVSFISSIPGTKSPANVYLLGSEDQGQTWSPVSLANKVTVNQPGVPTTLSSAFWANESKLSVTRDPTSKSVRAHLAYEYGDTVVRHPTSQGTEAPHHTALEFVNGTLTTVITERDISNVPATQNKDIDNLALFARGGTVMVMWRSDRNTYTGASGSSLNQLFGTFSVNGGVTFRKEFLLGDMRPPLGPTNGTLDPKINGTTGASALTLPDGGLAVDGASLYFLWPDRSHNNVPPVNVRINERVILFYSNALGVNGSWKRKVITPYNAGLADIDFIDMVADKGRVLIAINSDERDRHKGIAGMAGTLTNTPADKLVVKDNQGSGNHTNQIQVLVSEDGANTFTNSWISKNSIDDGSVTATQGLTGVVSGSIATLKGTNFINCKNCQIEINGDVCHLAYEQEWYSGTNFQGEDLIMWVSTDGGRTWVNRVNATAGAGEAKGLTSNAAGSGTLGRSDVDSPFMSITSAGTAIVGFRLDRTHTITKDRAQVFARPAPLSVDVSQVSLTTGGTQTQPLDAGIANQSRLYLVAGSVTGTRPGFDLGAAHIPLQFDAWTSLTLALANSAALPKSRGQLDASGKARPGITVPTGLSSSLIGLKLYSAALIYTAPENFHLGTNSQTLELIK